MTLKLTKYQEEMAKNIEEGRNFRLMTRTRGKSLFEKRVFESLRWMDNQIKAGEIIIDDKLKETKKAYEEFKDCKLPFNNNPKS